MSRRVDDLDQVILPRTLSDRAGDGDAVRLLLGLVIHVGGAVMNLANFMGRTCIVQHPLGQRGLARVDMCRDTDVPNPREWNGFGAFALGHSRASECAG